LLVSPNYFRFEEQGAIEGLFEAISAAAESNGQVSEGKALSEREEAVLQWNCPHGENSVV
jgi:hypothetical protein